MESTQTNYYQRDNPTFSLQSVDEITKIVTEARNPPPSSRSVGYFGISVWGRTLEVEIKGTKNDVEFTSVMCPEFCSNRDGGYGSDRADDGWRLKKCSEVEEGGVLC
ncbi:Protein kinase, catalytic domain-containing protein [Artemisia annua]|uniref:Protein kinase, catalytic domain-containing protein n=1 Tax=Artemisia annua TaxID=35608 RepID=A0A2U1P4C3_ARTAN|nr:Protein kinase, catalytic domain-containing protein [Artemisia annua]